MDEWEERWKNGHMYVWMDIRVGGRVGYGWINGNKDVRYMIIDR